MSNPRFPIVSFVKSGANERDFAVVRKGLLEMILNPETKAATQKLLAGVVEQLTTLLVSVKDATEDANAPAAMPEALGAELVTIANGFTSMLGTMMPDSAALPPGDTVVAPVVAAEPTAEEKLAMTIQQLEGFIAELKGGGIAKSTVIDAIAKAMVAKSAVRDLVAKSTDTTTAKGMSVKRGVMAAMKTYNDGFTKFLQLLLELLPLVMSMQDATIEVTDPTLAPATAQPAGVAPPDTAAVVEEMSKKMVETMATEVGKAVKKGLDEGIAAAMKPVTTSIAAMSERVEAVAKARPASANINDDGTPIVAPRKQLSIREECANELGRNSMLPKALL